VEVVVSAKKYVIANLLASLLGVPIKLARNDDIGFFLLLALR